MLDDIIKIYLIEDYLNDIYKADITSVTSVNNNAIICAMKNVNSKISLYFLLVIP